MSLWARFRDLLLDGLGFSEGNPGRMIFGVFYSLGAACFASEIVKWAGGPRWAQWAVLVVVFVQLIA